MRDVLRRLRAAITPQALLLVVLSLLMIAFFGTRGGKSTGTTALERRIADTLSGVDGAGRVRVVIKTRKVQQAATGFSAAEAQEVPSGVVAVAEGASDPLVNMRLTQALCSLLGLPASAVSVMSGTGGE